MPNYVITRYTLKNLTLLNIVVVWAQNVTPKHVLRQKGYVLCECEGIIQHNFSDLRFFKRGLGT